ncbi:non-muscle caldesmon-like isoform X2 [Brienomyrus brachyistius]|uniref:non-muscle caldesmon-like isoform X2 n=1 Tax=Brienomyrus brachyistius TaxID=42636 RepID=UPI0020B26D08|nr:non-muscle caldesmon-like isoform X2 [Brienomyrus brachyistius]
MIITLHYSSDKAPNLPPTAWQNSRTSSSQPGPTMDDDFERRRELRRQKREEMRMEAERLMYQRNEDDEEEAARERRRRARQERMRSKDLEEPVTAATEGEALDSNSSMAERDAAGRKGDAATHNDEEGDHGLQERLAKREDRRQRRALEAAERQWRELEAPAEPKRSQPGEKEEEEPEEEEEEVPRRSFLGEQVDHETVSERPAGSHTELSEKPVNSDDDAERGRSRAEVEEEEGGVSGNEAEGGTVVPLGKEDGEEMRLVEVEGTSEEELGEQEVPGEGAEGEGGLSELELVCEEKMRRSFSQDEETPEEKPKWPLRKEEQKPPGDPEPVSPQMENSPQSKQPNGGLNDDFTARHRKPERTLSRGSTHSAEEEQEDAARQEAERKLEELKRRRGETESEEYQRMRQRQQEAEAELEDLKRRREERRKVLEEEERAKREEQEEKKAKEEEEKRRMKQEIERRRAEAAEKRHRVEDTGDGESRRPFQCLGPKTGSMKIGERAEFLNKSAQRSSVKSSHSPVVSKIDNRLEQYTTAVQTNKEIKAPKSAAIDLPVVTDGVRSIKSMWERGNVFSSAGTPGSTNKETASMKIGVAGRINDWLNKVPESGKSGGGKPADLRPGDVTNKRNLWENKGSAPDKVTVGGKSKSATNGH